jgi:hypothetical protein
MVKPDFDEYLRPDDVNDGDILIVLGQGEFLPAEKSEYHRAELRVPTKLPDGRVKKTKVNIPSYREISEAYGKDTAEWVSRPLRVRKALRQNTPSGIRDVIYLQPVQAILKTETTQPQTARLSCPICHAEVSGSTDDEVQQRLREHISAGCK